MTIPHVQLNRLVDELLCKTTRQEHMDRLAPVCENWMISVALLREQGKIDADVARDWRRKFDIYRDITTALAGYDHGQYRLAQVRPWLWQRLDWLMQAAEDFVEFRQTLEHVSTLLTKFAQQP